MNILSKVVSTAKDFAEVAADVANTGVDKAQGVAGSVTDFVNDTYFLVLSRDEYDSLMKKLDVICNQVDEIAQVGEATVDIIEGVMAIRGHVAGIRDIVSNKEAISE